MRERLTQALLAAGFVFDPANENHRTSSNENRYTRYRLPYLPITDGQGALRPEILIETALWPVRLPTVEREVKSFYAEAFQLPPEVTKINCVAIPETAAEKFVALTRRIAAEQEAPTNQHDKTLVRHIYDLHATRDHYDIATVAALIPTIMQANAESYGNQFPPYREDPVIKASKALLALITDPDYAQSYAEFLRDMVYGEKIEFDVGTNTLSQLAASANLIQK